MKIAKRLEKEDLFQMGSRIQSARRSKGYNQTEFAKLLNITRNSLSGIECGTAGFSVWILLKVCELTDVTTNYILMGEDSYRNAPLLNEDDNPAIIELVMLCREIAFKNGEISGKTIKSLLKAILKVLK